jgi:hypothetical protein
MKADELLTRLGKVTANAQVFEILTARILGTCIGVETDLAIRVTRRLQLRASLGLIDELVETGSSRVDPDKVRAWLKLADKAIEARNRVMHTAWHGNPKTGEVLGIIGKKGLFESRSSDDLQKDHESIVVAVDEAAKLLGMESISSGTDSAGDKP